MDNEAYWQALDQLISTCELVIDRPKDKPHPKYPALIYPLDYGYLKGTQSGDGAEVDCWIGSMPEHKLKAMVFTIDLVKRDMEGKLLLGCTRKEMQTVLQFHNNCTMMSALLIER